MLVSVECAHCGSTYTKSVQRYNGAEKRGGRHFCSQSCLGASRTVRITRPCAECGLLVSRKPSEITRNESGRVFCTGSCSATYLNRMSPKKARKLAQCKGCGTEIRVQRRLCKECQSARQIGQLTVGELREKHGTNALARRAIASNARYRFLKVNPKPACAVCGYSVHVETAHRKDVADFDAAALVSDVNSLDNLVGLCPNHHWEFDRGLLKV